MTYWILVSIAVFSDHTTASTMFNDATTFKSYKECHKLEKQTQGVYEDGFPYVESAFCKKVVFK